MFLSGMSSYSPASTSRTLDVLLGLCSIHIVDVHRDYIHLRKTMIMTFTFFSFYYFMKYDIYKNSDMNLIYFFWLQLIVTCIISVPYSAYLQYRLAKLEVCLYFNKSNIVTNF